MIFRDEREADYWRSAWCALVAAGYPVEESHTLADACIEAMRERTPRSSDHSRPITPSLGDLPTESATKLVDAARAVVFAWDAGTCTGRLFGRLIQVVRDVDLRVHVDPVPPLDDSIQRIIVAARTLYCGWNADPVVAWSDLGHALHALDAAEKTP